MKKVHHQIFRPTKLNSIWQSVEINYVVYIHNFMSQIFGVPKSSFLLIFHKWSYHGIQFHFASHTKVRGIMSPAWWSISISIHTYVYIYYLWSYQDRRIVICVNIIVLLLLNTYIFWSDLRIAELTVNLKSKMILQQVWDQVLILRKIWLL